MSTISHDYYAVLGVAKNATPGEIKGQFRRLMKEHHPDQYNGLKAKYQLGGDTVLLKILEDKIKEAEEFCKLLNEAFSVLSDPAKRKQYDNETNEPEIEEPKISVSPKTISFGTLKNGEKKSSVFVIKNDGGPAAGVNIDWEGAKPAWGDLIIEPDEDNVFPIKVTVLVNTTGIPAGTKDDKILITVDSKVYAVNVLLSIRIPATVPAAPSTTTTTAGPKTSGCGIPVGLLFVLIVVSLFVIGGLWSVNNANQQQQQQNSEATQSAVTIVNNNAFATTIANQAAIQSANQIATATFIARRPGLIKISGVKLLTFGEVQPGRCGNLQPCNKVAFIQFTITNNTDDMVNLNIRGPCGQPGSINPDYGPEAIFIDGHMAPNKSGTMICMLDSSYDYDPGRYVIGVFEPSCWNIYPYTGKIEDCQ